MQQAAQALGLFLFKGPFDVVRNGRASLETGQPGLIEAPDGIAHRLVTATQLLANPASRRAPRIRQQHLAAAHHKGIRRTHTRFQRSAFALGKLAYKYGFWHAAHYAIFKVPCLRLH